MLFIILVFDHERTGTMKRLLLLSLAMLVLTLPLPACTSAIVTGRATADGRPILWKHRDSDEEHNKLRFFQGPRYSFLGIVNSDTLEDEVWMGSNSAGFSIINTAAYNMNIGVKCAREDEEGILMREALGSCATVSEFESFLESGKGNWGVDANFGVIDAGGGAAYFEVGCTRFVKYDVNDPAVAPDGYLLRTNFAVSGDPKHRKGTVRFLSAEQIFKREFSAHKLSVGFILREADKNLEHAVLRRNLAAATLPEDSSTHEMVLFRDFTVRNSTVSSMIIQGVKPGENPDLTTLWTVLGFPLTTVVIPVWVSGGAALPALTLSADGKVSPINEKSLQLKNRCFPLTVDNYYDYLDLSVVMNKAGTGITQLLMPSEQKVFRQTMELVEKWRSSGFRTDEALKHYTWLDEFIGGIYRKDFGL